MKIVCNKNNKKTKDGGSKHWEILNPQDCGFDVLEQDNSIKNIRNGEYTLFGKFYGVKNGVKTLVDIFNDVVFIDKYKYKTLVKTLV